MNVLFASIIQRDYQAWVLAPEHSFFWWIVIGLVAGWLAGTVSRGRGFGCLANILLGLVGAVIGGWIFQKLDIPYFGFFFGNLAAATVGAVLLVAMGRFFSGSSE